VSTRDAFGVISRAIQTTGSQPLADTASPHSDDNLQLEHNRGLMNTLRPTRDGSSADSTAARLIDAVITITEEHEVVYANPAVRRIIGCRPDELLGRSILELVPLPLRTAYRKRLDGYIESIRTNADPDPFEINGRRSDGAE
jgi:PAS domain-containing protein